MTAILRLQLDDKDPVRVNSAINQLAEFVDRGGGGGGGRTRLTTNTTFYVSTTGSDANSGTVGSPFLTIQHAYDVISNTLDTAGFTVTIQCASGTYTTRLFVSLPWTGGGFVILDLGGGTISTSATCLEVACLLPNTLTIQNGTLASSGAHCIIHTGTGSLSVGTGMTFGTAASGAHMWSAGSGSKIITNVAYTITGGALWHQIATSGNTIVGGGFNVAISGTVTISFFAYASRLGILDFPSRTFSGSTPTGTRYNVDTNGVIFTNGGGANYFPGTVAGSTSTGGQYT